MTKAKSSRPGRPRSRLSAAIHWERGEKRPSGPSLKLLSIVKARGLDAIA